MITSLAVDKRSPLINSNIKQKEMQITCSTFLCGSLDTPKERSPTKLRKLFINQQKIAASLIYLLFYYISL